MASTEEFHRQCLLALAAAEVPYLVGGDFAFQHYTGVGREARDLDVFIREDDIAPALMALARAGALTELTSPEWMARASSEANHADVIYGVANGLGAVDDEWFAYAERGVVLGVPISFCPVEELIWSKAFVMERERFDGADALHLIRARAGRLDWARLARRFDRHWQVLFSHLVLFRFVYPNDVDVLPGEILRSMAQRFADEVQVPPLGPRVCRGTLLSRAQYVVDVERWGYGDGRFEAREVKASPSPTH